MSDVKPDVIAKIMAIDAESRSTIPLRLAVAARVAFPDGTMGAAGLRKERDKGRLATEMIAGKEYTTLAAIKRMRELCRVQPKMPASSGGTPAGIANMQDGDIALAAAKMTLQKLREGLPSKRKKHRTP